MGLPFAVPFFFGCDGAMAPLMGVSPGIQKIPWQLNAKELGNHVAWTLAAEAVHRLVPRIAARQSGKIASPTATGKEERL
jgi:putative membrane protein